MQNRAGTWLCSQLEAVNQRESGLRQIRHASPPVPGAAAWGWARSSITSAAASGAASSFVPRQAQCRCLASALVTNPSLVTVSSVPVLNPRRNVVLIGWLLSQLPRVGGHKALERCGKKAFLAQAGAAWHSGGDGEAASS